MIRIEPGRELAGLPCSNVAVSCAVGKTVIRETSHQDGYMTLRDNNRFVRDNLAVKRYRYFKKTERPILRDLKLEKAIVCVYGHLVYLEGDRYWSFFDNENDSVVAYWELK